MKKKIKIRAAVLTKINKILKIQNIYHERELSDNQALVKLYYTGICGSQIGEIKGVKGKNKYLPHLLGHEATGRILKISSNHKHLKKNDKVILHWQKNVGRNSKTPNYTDIKNKKINAGWVTTFNNYAIVSSNRLTKLPKEINLKEGVLFGCSLTTAYGSIFKESKINLNKKNKILITGGGMIGQAILIFIYSKYQNISLLEKSLKKIQFLKKIYPNIKIIKNLSAVKNNDFDYVYETTGSKKIIEKVYRSIKTSGKLMLIGVPHYKSKIKINTLEINYGKRIIGSYGGGVVPNKDIKNIIYFLKNSKAKLKNLYGKIYNFNEINLIIKKLMLGKIIKKPIIKF